MEYRIGGYVLLASIAAALVSTPAWAVDLALPGVNVGATSFEDGGGGIGHMFQSSNSRFDATRTYDADGNRRAVNYDRTLWVSRMHYAYISPQEGLGGNLGAEVVIPLLDLDLAVGPAQVNARGAGSAHFLSCFHWT